MSRFGGLSEERPSVFKTRKLGTHLSTQCSGDERQSRPCAAVNRTPDLWSCGSKQDGATCHTARATIDLLKDTFGDRLISRFGPVNWPPRSCDLTPLDYFLWAM
ncbi:hypothetical protein TNCV_4271631 [Trichonephila clavipes]|nr:hypothetical protein TNCV_4271631 [Trichonephila clavipes]